MLQMRKIIVGRKGKPSCCQLKTAQEWSEFHFIVVTVCERGSSGPWPRLSMATGGTSAGPDVQVIKQSIAYRAKYRKDQGPTPCIKVFSPGLAVPHPRNRGGDPAVSMRTRELGNFIAREGNDPMEAASSAVAVEGRAGADCGTFQINFEGQVAKKDPDMAAKVNGITAVIGTLSHGHWNCLARNITAGKKAARATRAVVTAKGAAIARSNLFWTNRATTASTF